ncbi:MAG: glycosyltransferase [Actinomycetota bacterium]|nr:glycosyltransferase [Actinomycetota bacterium]
MRSSQAGAAPLASVVIPAHNEASVIGRTLATLTTGVAPGELDIVVVCNGCTDDTVSAARGVPGVRVREIPEPGKSRAVAVGNRMTTVFPRVHLDADVEIGGVDVLALVAAVRDRGVLAAGPVRRMPLERSSWPVRAYYRVWQQLPQVSRGLFGRGVFALSEEGQARVDALPTVMGDDLAISDAFADHERTVVQDAAVVVHPPRTIGDLVRRRTRVATGNAQAADLGVRRPDSVTTPRTMLRVGLRDPRAGLCLPVFLGVSLFAKWQARAAVRTGDFDTWLRDESSRAPAGGPGRE